MVTSGTKLCTALLVHVYVVTGVYKVLESARSKCTDLKVCKSVHSVGWWDTLWVLAPVCWAGRRPGDPSHAARSTPPLSSSFNDMII